MWFMLVHVRAPKQENYAESDTNLIWHTVLNAQKLVVFKTWKGAQ